MLPPRALCLCLCFLGGCCGLVQMVVPFVDPKTKSKIMMANTMADLESRFRAKDLPTTIGGKGAEDGVFVRIQDLRRADVDY